MFIKPIRYTDACLWNLTRKCATDQIMIAHAGCWYMCTYYFVRIAHVNYICSIKVEVVEQTDRHRDRDRDRQTDRRTDRQRNASTTYFSIRCVNPHQLPLT